MLEETKKIASSAPKGENEKKDSIKLILYKLCYSTTNEIVESHFYSVEEPILMEIFLQNFLPVYDNLSAEIAKAASEKEKTSLTAALHLLIHILKNVDTNLSEAEPEVVLPDDL